MSVDVFSEIKVTKVGTLYSRMDPQWSEACRMMNGTQ